MEEGKKKNKGLIVLVVILILIILGLVGYIMYGQNIVNNTQKEESTSTKEETVISEELTSELLDKVPYFDHVIDYENKDLVPYYNDKYIVSDIDKELLIYEAYNAAVNTSYVETFEKSNFPTGIGGGKCIKIVNLNDFIEEKTFFIDVTNLGNKDAYVTNMFLSNIDTNVDLYDIFKFNIYYVF